MNGLRDRYGRWALVAGASAGLGEAFARQLAAARMDLFLLARRQEALDALAADLRAQYLIEVRTLPVDLASPTLGEQVAALTADAEVGVVVYNAAHSVIGPFLDHPVEDHLRVVDVNCRGPLLLAHTLGRRMAQRRRGAIVLMTSLAGAQGGPWLSSYAASKAFNLVLAEGLWDELGAAGVDVIACRAGATLTPGSRASNPRPSSTPLLDPDAVVRRTLAALGRGPSVVPGWFYAFSSFVMSRLLPRTWATRIMGRATRRLYTR